MAAPMTMDNNRFDVFVGNVRDNTTEDQLHQVFSIVGTLFPRTDKKYVHVDILCTHTYYGHLLFDPFAP